MSIYVNDAYFNPEEPMPPQTADWTCAACSLAWLNRAMQIDRGTSEWTAVDLIGNPDNINSAVGLVDGSGARLAQLLLEDRGASTTGWVSFHQAYLLADRAALLLGGAGWYHWVGVRRPNSGVLEIANSAQGWQGVYSTLDEQQWDCLAPFAAVIVPLHVDFPECNPPF